MSGKDTLLQTSVELDAAFSGESDNGLAFGATMDIDTGAAPTDPEIFISSAFGRLNFGSIAIAADGIGLADVGEAGIGVDNAIEDLRTSDTKADVSYVYSIDGLTLTLSTNIGSKHDKNVDNEGDTGFAVAYKAGDLSMALGFADDDSTGDTSTSLSVGYTMGDVALGAMFVSQDRKDAALRDQDGYGISAAYTIDALTLTAVYASVDGDTVGKASQDDFGVGFSYNLGGGVTVVGGMGEVNKLDVWDLGIAMKF